MSNTIPPRDLVGRFGGHGAFKAKTPAPTTMFTRLANAEPNLRLALTSAIENLVEIGDALEGASVPAIVIAASPGAGKSRVAREVLADLAENDRVVFHAPTLALSEEAVEHAHELEGKAHIIRGRSAPDPTTADEKMCRKGIVNFSARSDKLTMPVSELASTCFFIAGAARSLSGNHRRLTFIVAHGGQLFHRHVAAGDGPFVVLLQHQRADEPDHGFTVRE
ncbi:hypothetical protein RA2_04227 [Roseovarius sp. A-2]|nr:hypothetical protein RA2_04227 [Roseovarius sp. A-2]